MSAVLQPAMESQNHAIDFPGDFYRPLGVHGAPHVGDPLTNQRVALRYGVPVEHEDSDPCDCSECADQPPVRSALRDLSVEATPASEDLKNALMIIEPLQDSMLREALQRLITNALQKIEGRK